MRQSVSPPSPQDAVWIPMPAFGNHGLHWFKAAQRHSKLRFFALRLGAQSGFRDSRLQALLDPSGNFREAPTTDLATQPKREHRHIFPRVIRAGVVGIVAMIGC